MWIFYYRSLDNNNLFNFLSNETINNLAFNLPRLYAVYPEVDFWIEVIIRFIRFPITHNLYDSLE